MSTTPANYAWWRQHAGEWKLEVDARRRRMPIYRLQEMFLLDYFTRAAPARVLEFGCGFGRHLEYLRTIGGVEIHGYDQSAAMLDQMQWADAGWKRDRIRQGEPLGPLPYPDDWFDISFTVSVMIHVRPEDLVGILRELARVTRGHLLHIENRAISASRLTSSAHDGCWAHDLESAYREIGLQVERLPEHFVLEDCYRSAVRAGARLPAVSKLRARQSLALDEEISQEIAEDRREIARLHRIRDELERLVERLHGESRELAQTCQDLRARSRSAEADRKALLQRARSAASRVEHLAKDAEAAQCEISTQRERARTAEDKLIDLQKRTRVAREREQALRRDFERLRSDAVEQWTRARRAEARINELHDRLRVTRAADEGRRVQAERVQARVQELQRRQKQLLTKQGALLAELREVRGELNEEKARADRGASKIEGVLARAASRARRLTEMHERLYRSESELRALRSGLRALVGKGERDNPARKKVDGNE